MRNPWFKFRVRRYSGTNDTILSSIDTILIYRSVCLLTIKFTVYQSFLFFLCLHLYVVKCFRMCVCRFLHVGEFLLKFGVLQYQSIFFDQPIIFIPDTVPFTVFCNYSSVPLLIKCNGLLSVRSRVSKGVRSAYRHIAADAIHG
jgi:hypothetical protein